MSINVGHSNGMKRNTLRIMKTRNPDLREQEFSFNAPAALRVQLAGSFTQWQNEPFSMTRGADGLWHTKVRLAPGTYQYRFIVDGAWHDDPTCTLQIPTEFGTTNMLREVNRAA
jgi:1,4-alpha-glucan branching enzyme